MSKAYERLPGRGWYNLACWNGLSEQQQEILIKGGHLGLRYVTTGRCKRGAQVGIEVEGQAALGPRFYCRQCAIKYLRGLP